MILSFSKKFPWGDPTNFEKKIITGTKIHTIREDPHRRWREGMKIHFATGVRTPNYNQFHEDECTAVFDLLIEPRLKTVSISTEHSSTKIQRMFYNVSVKEFAKNDGFDSTEDFWKWFDKPTEARLIQWTDFRYE